MPDITKVFANKIISQFYSPLDMENHKSKLNLRSPFAIASIFILKQVPSCSPLLPTFLFQLFLSLSLPLFSHPFPLSLRLQSKSCSEVKECNCYSSDFICPCTGISSVPTTVSRDAVLCCSVAVGWVLCLRRTLRSRNSPALY